MTPRDVVTPIANLIERLWPRDIAYPERDPARGASHLPGCGRRAFLAGLTGLKALSQLFVNRVIFEQSIGGEA
jgi:hypothetical protein